MDKETGMVNILKFSPFNTVAQKMSSFELKKKKNWID